MRTRQPLLAVTTLLAAAAAGGTQDAPAPLPKGAVARLGTPRGIAAHVNHVVPIPPDFKTFAFIEPQKGIVVQDAATGREVARFNFDGQTPVADLLTASADGKRLVSRDFRDLVVREIATGKVVLRHYPPPPAAPERYGNQSLVSASGDGKRIAYADRPVPPKKDEKPRDLGVLVWDVDANRLVVRVAVPEQNFVLTQLSADGKRLATWPMILPAPPGPPVKADPIPPPRPVGLKGQQECVVRVWDVETGKVLCRVVTSHPRPAVILSPGGECVAAADEDGTLEWWDVDTNARRASVRADKKLGLLPAFSADGKTLGGLDRTGKVRRWAAADGRELDPITLTPEPAVSLQTGFGFADPDRPLEWRFTGSVVNVAGVGQKPGPPGNSSPVYAIGFPRGGRREVVTLSASGFIRWDGGTGRPLSGPAGVPPPDEDGVRRPPYSAVHASSDGTRGVGVTPGRLVGGQREPARIVAFDPLTGRRADTFPTKHTAEEQVFTAANPDLTRLVVLRPSPNPKLETADCTVWDPAARKVLAEFPLPLPGRLDPADGLSVSPDGTQLVTAVRAGLSRPGGTVITAWDLKTGKELGRVVTAAGNAHHTTAANGAGAVFLDGRVHTIDFGSARVGEASDAPVGGGMTLAPRFNAAGTRFVVAHQTGPRAAEVRVYDWPGCSVRNTFQLPADGVTAIAFSPDGTTLATAARDNTVLLWDLTAREK